MSIRAEYQGEAHGMRGTLGLVATLAAWMFRKLWKNRDKVHWLNTSGPFLMNRLHAEYQEFVESPSWEEAADLANLAAMAADWYAINAALRGE